MKCTQALSHNCATGIAISSGHSQPEYLIISFPGCKEKFSYFSNFFKYFSATLRPGPVKVLGTKHSECSAQIACSATIAYKVCNVKRKMQKNPQKPGKIPGQHPTESFEFRTATTGSGRGKTVPQDWAAQADISDCYRIVIDRAWGA